MKHHSIRVVAGALLAASCLFMGPAEAGVSRMEIASREPFAGGEAFGGTGAYERIVGRFYGELDPADKLNAEIVDLDKAPRNPRGWVEYSSDFFILKPVDMAKGNGALLYDVNNRGNKRALLQFNDAPPRNDPRTAEDAGNGFLMRHGFTVVWSGWLPDLPNINSNLRIQVPAAAGLTGRVWDEFLFNDAVTMQAKLSFPAANPTRASLLIRGRNVDEPTAVPADQWEFADASTIRLLPAGTPFKIGVIYQLVYDAVDPPVSGIGFAATRDLVAFLRYDATANPLATAGRPGITRALAHGTSQSGRYLRDFVYRGFNEDEGHRQVFDGINPHVSTARLFLNQRFAQPNRMSGTGHGFLFFPDTSFPFAYETQADPFTGRRDGILARCSARDNCPKVAHTISATEYWESGQSLITTDAAGQRDGTLPDNVRVYHVASTQHIEIATMPKGVCAVPHNPVDRRPVLRAVLLGLDKWVKDNAPPPASRYPRLADGSLVQAASLGFAVPGMSLPAHGPNPKPRMDYGPEFAEGIISKVLPTSTGDAYGVLVPKVDSDGNEIGGVRLPEISVPLGTATGWAVRAADAGGAGELCYLDGSFQPLAKTKAARTAKNDPRLSVEERYRDKDDYLAKLRAAAVALEREGYILAEDVPRIVERRAALAW
jgi:hypothetical protein